MTDKEIIFIQVVLPLRLNWEPFYKVQFINGIKKEDIFPGQLVTVTFARRKYTAVITEVNVTPNISEKKISFIKEINRNSSSFSAEDVKFWRALSNYYMCSLGEVYSATFESGTLEELEANNRKPIKDKIEDNIILTEHQEKAFSQIKKIHEERKPALLKGITGSGKTEIYLKLAIDVINQGKNVLYLVPEIALSRQLEKRLKDVFGGLLRMFNSSETKKQKRITAATTLFNKYIILGTRSSILLPHRNLGLIIVDEEHDNSYKQDAPAPRYNGRDSAIMLAAMRNCRVIIGSATPSMESMYNALSGKYGLVELNERYYGAGNPRIEIIDTSAEWKKRGMIGNFSRKLISHIYENKQKGGQTMILRSRRAYSPVLQCSECGFMIKCPHCDVPLAYHKQTGASEGGVPYAQGNNSDGILTCHYCGYSIEMSHKCPKCGAALKSLGSGTQKIEEEVQNIFPDFKVERLDSDVSSSKKELNRIIKEFSKGETDILIGTQMVAKGFDFSNLTLVAVIEADSFLGMQDFRADEKSYQILRQFRGRCGRRENEGLFIVQTRIPSHPVYQALHFNTEGKSSEYYKQLFLERKMFNYPPFSRIVNIIIKDKNQARLNNVSEMLAIILRKTLEQNALTVGPFSPMIEKISDEYIKHIRISLPKNKQLQSLKKKISDILEDFSRDNGADGHIFADVDPI